MCMILKFLAFFLCFASVSWGGWNEGRKAFVRGDFSKALRELQPLAENGNVKAQVILGGMYQNGWGVEQNPAKAIMWLELAAQKGNPRTQYELGKLHYEEVQHEKALKWYILAANQGHLEAQLELGFIHCLGLAGLKPDPEEALRWYMLAENQGSTKAQVAIGNIYEGEINWAPMFRRDINEAVFWYRRAANQGDAGGKIHLGFLYLRGRGVPQDYKVAAQLLSEGLQQNTTSMALSIDAMSHLGVLYAKGWGVSQDLVQANLWLNLATTAMTISGMEGGKSYEETLKNRDEVASHLSSDELARAQGLARARWSKMTGTEESELVNKAKQP